MHAPPRQQQSSAVRLMSMFRPLRGPSLTFRSSGHLDVSSFGVFFSGAMIKSVLRCASPLLVGSEPASLFNFLPMLTSLWAPCTSGRIAEPVSAPNSAHGPAIARCTLYPAPLVCWKSRTHQMCNARANCFGVRAVAKLAPLLPATSRHCSFWSAACTHNHTPSIHAQECSSCRCARPRAADGPQRRMATEEADGELLRLGRQLPRRQVRYKQRLLFTRKAVHSASC